MKPNLRARIVAEFLGTAFLVAGVVGSGIMAERLAGGNVALALLANTIATGAALVALILAFAPISGAHLNPVVSLADAMEGGLAWSETLPYMAAQILGGVSGSVAASWHVWTSARVAVSPYPRRTSAILERVHRNFRTPVCDLGMFEVSFERRALCCRELHRLRPLVHGINFFR